MYLSLVQVHSSKIRKGSGCVGLKRLRVICQESVHAQMCCAGPSYCPWCGTRAVVCTLREDRLPVYKARPEGSSVQGLCICFREPTWDLDAQTSHLSLGGCSCSLCCLPCLPRLIYPLEKQILFGRPTTSLSTWTYYCHLSIWWGVGAGNKNINMSIVSSKDKIA